MRPGRLCDSHQTCDTVELAADRASCNEKSMRTTSESWGKCALELQEPWKDYELLQIL